MGRSGISISCTKHTHLIYNMATIVVLGGTIKADKKADFVAYCKEAVANCKAANGCEWAKGCIDTEDNSKFAIFQKWTDDAARKAFAEKLNPRASWPMLLVLCWKLALIRNEFLAHTIKSKRNTVLLRKNLLESRIWIDDLCTGLI